MKKEWLTEKEERIQEQKEEVPATTLDSYLFILLKT
jgi:hypothetical protein